MILVTGASGNAGGAVLKEVLKAKRPVKATYRSREHAGKAPAEVGAVIADFTNKPSMGHALEGVYLTTPPVSESQSNKGSLECQALSAKDRLFDYWRLTSGGMLECAA